MESIMIYPDKGYEVEIWLDDVLSYVADIKHPCGEIVEAKAHFPSKSNAVYWATDTINLMDYAKHDCNDEYCENNRYLKHFKGSK